MSVKDMQKQVEGMQIGWQISVIDALSLQFFPPPPRSPAAPAASCWIMKDEAAAEFFKRGQGKKGGKFKITRLKCQGTRQNKKGGSHTPSSLVLWWCMAVGIKTRREGIIKEMTFFPAQR